MAKSKGDRRSGRAGARGRRPAGRSGKRQSSQKAKSRSTSRRVTAKARKAAPSRSVKRSAPKRSKTARPAAANHRRKTAAAKRPRLDRPRRILTDNVPTPPSSLNLDRRPSAARSGRAEMRQHQHEHGNLNPEIAAGDVDVNVEDAYFTGEEAPGGDNPTPDQDVVDDIGKALGVQYADNEELKSSDKVGERDKHRWELDPASSEDYKDRK